MKIDQNTIKKYGTLILGALILSFGLYNIHSQSQITEGGILGFALIIQHWLGISPGITTFILDISCYILGIRYLGKSFLKYAIIASCTFASSYTLFEHIGYVLPDLTAHPLIAALAGGLFVGLGVGLVVRIGGACGGDDALAMIISKFAHCSIAKAYMLSDISVLLLSITYLPINRLFYCLITVCLSSFIIGRIHPSDVKQEKPLIAETDRAI